MSGNGVQPSILFPWGDGRRFYSYARYMRNLFGGRVQKLTVDAGLSCPHRADRDGPGGCSYCNNAAFNPSYCSPEKGVTQQLAEGIEFHRNRYRRAEGYLAYFQAYTNTYADVDTLRAMFEEALGVAGVRGLVVGTRPDCLPQPVLELLVQLSQRTSVTVELGVESLHDATLRRVRRGHAAAVSLEAIARLHDAGLPVGVHLIVGLPGEGEEEVMETLETIGRQPISSVKFHQLQVLKGTLMAQEWAANPAAFSLLGLERYLALARRMVMHLPATIAVERICAEAPPRFLLAPDWGTLRNDVILARFERELEEHDAWQGKALGVVGRSKPAS